MGTQGGGIRSPQEPAWKLGTTRLLAWLTLVCVLYSKTATAGTRPCWALGVHLENYGALEFPSWLSD